MLGLAVLFSHQLLDYRVIQNKLEWSNSKKEHLVTLIQSYCKMYNITDIVIAIPQQYYQTDEWKELLEAIALLARNTGIVFICYELAEIYRMFANGANPTRASLIRRMAMLYDELEVYEMRERHNKQKYYIKLFEAVACASVHVLAIQEKQG